MIDIENLSEASFKKIVVAKSALDTANRAMAAATASRDKARETLRSLGVGIDGEMPADPEPRGVIANGGGIVPARNPVTGRTRTPRATKPRSGIKLEPSVVASVRQALEAAAGPVTTAELVEATELRAPVVIAACREIGATQLGKNRGTKWDIPRAPIPADDDEPAAGDVAEDDDEDEGEVA